MRIHCSLSDESRPAVPSWLRMLWLMASGIGLFPSHSQAQDPHFSQFYAAPLYLNPALMGREKDISFGLNHRTQWKSAGYPQNTSQLSVILPRLNSNPRRMPLYSAGFSVARDAAGENSSFTTTDARLAFAYNLPFDPSATHLISIGAQAGVVQKQLNGSQLQWGSQFDPSLGYNPALASSYAQEAYQAFFPVFNLGAVWFYNPQKHQVISNLNAYMGITANNLNQPDQSLFLNQHSRLPILWKLHGGCEWKLDEQWSMAPAYLYMRQRGNTQLNTGVYISYQTLPRPKSNPLRLSLGSWYRLHDAAIASLGIESTQYTIGFSYDITVSGLGAYNNGQGAYEISLRYRIVRSSSLSRISTPIM